MNKRPIYRGYDLTDPDRGKWPKPGARVERVSEKALEEFTGLHPEDEAASYRKLAEWAEQRAAAIEAENEAKGVPER